MANAVANTCGQAGMSRGCCSWVDSQEGCYVPDGMCYCDSECKTAGDCCADVPSTFTCTACKYMHVMHLVKMKMYESFIPDIKLCSTTQKNPSASSQCKSM